MDIESTHVFSRSFQELPILFLKGGAIVPTGPVIQHVGEASPTDTITLLIALDDNGKSLFFLFWMTCYPIFLCTASGVLVLTWSFIVY